MDRFTQRFLSQVQVLQDHLESLLETDWGPKEVASAARPAFEVETDLNQLETLGWALPDREPEKSHALFEKLALYFDAGFCFHGHGEPAPPNWLRWRFESSFFRGRPFHLSTEQRRRAISLPMMSLTEVRKIRADFLLKELDLPAALAGPDNAAFVIRPSDIRLWILFSSLPDVFLKSHLTAIHEVCLKLLADFPE